MIANDFVLAHPHSSEESKQERDLFCKAFVEVVWFCSVSWTQASKGRKTLEAKMGKAIKSGGMSGMGRSKVGGVGAQLLAKMGWKEGTGLGPRKDGSIEPVRHRRRQAQEEGLGRKNSTLGDNWWEKLLRNAYGAPKNAKPVDLFEACEGRRCRPHGTAKLARIEAQDVASKRVDNGSGKNTVTTNLTNLTVQDKPNSSTGCDEASVTNVKIEDSILDDESRAAENAASLKKVKTSSGRHVKIGRTSKMRNKAKSKGFDNQLSASKRNEAIAANLGSRIGLKVEATILKKRKRRRQEK